MSKYWDDTPNLLNASTAKRYCAEPFSPLAARCPAPFKRTPAMEFGSNFHQVVEDRGLSNFDCIDLASRKSKKWDEFVLRCGEAGKTPVLASEHAVLCDMFSALERQVSAETLVALNEGEAEKDMYTDDRKILMDNVCKHHIRDWKTCASVDPDFISRQAYNLKYYIQEYHYCDVYEEVTGVRPQFTFVYIQTSIPYEVVEVSFDHRFKEFGRIEYTKARKRWEKWKDETELPGYSYKKVSEMSLPTWVHVRESATDVFAD